jgi:hypothetical protein
MSFQKPINANVTQRFGADFVLNGVWYYKSIGYQGHNGDDYAAPIGTPVYAADEGTVTFEGWGQNHSWMGTPAGICVLINNGGLYSGYAHLNGTVVNKGQHVNKGQLIGYVGQTGAATGPHLHFEALPLSPNFKNGYAGRIDPSQFIEAAATGASADQVRQAYRDILGREADAGGLTTYVGKPLDFVRSDLASSDEYRQRQAAIAAQAQAEADARTKAQQAALKAAQEAEAKAIADAEALRLAEELAKQEAAAEAAKTTYTQADRDRDNETNSIVKLIFAIVKAIQDAWDKIYKK